MWLRSKPRYSSAVRHIGQVLTYKALVKKHRPNAGVIHCFLFGYEKSGTFFESSDVQIRTFGELITQLRDEYHEYAEVLRERREEVAIPTEIEIEDDELPF